MPYTADLESQFQPELAAGFSVDQLNALYLEQHGWRRIKARSSHEDVFGDEVKPGAYYFARRVGPGVQDVMKLSQASLERVLAVLFFSNAHGASLAGAEAARRQAALLNDMSAVVHRSPGAAS